MAVIDFGGEKEEVVTVKSSHLPKLVKSLKTK